MNATLLEFSGNQGVKLKCNQMHIFWFCINDRALAKIGNLLHSDRFMDLKVMPSNTQILGASFVGEDHFA